MRNCLIILLMLAFFSGCAGKPAGSASLYDYKTQYVGDNSKVSHIAGAMQYPEGAACESVKIQSEKEPYGLTVYLSGTEVSNASVYQKNAIICFALIDNLDEMKYQSGKSGAILAEFYRDELERNQNIKCSEIGRSKESFEAFLKQ